MLLMTLLTRFKGRLVGCDKYGHKYYEEKFLFSKPNRAPRRWVIYHGEPDASKVPAEWHGWLHFTYETPLPPPSFEWQKKHLRNLTGTSKAYVPTASLLRSSDNRGIQKPYEAWCPATPKKSDKQVKIEKEK